jgi:hypothetical protein
MFSSFIKPITNLLTNHPGVAFATAFAAVAAPAFLKDENRGYLRTAVVTAPVIAAMGIAGPGLVTSASRNIRSGLRFSREMPFFNQNYSINFKGMREAVRSGKVNAGPFNPLIKNWADNMAIDFFAQADRGAPPIETSMKSAMDLFDRLMPDQGKRTLLTYAVEGARLRIASPMQLNTMINMNPLKPMAESELRGIVAANRADPRFIHEFSHRLRWAERLHDSGVMLHPINVVPSTLKTWSLQEALPALAKQRPLVAEALQKAVAEGRVTSAMVTAEMVADHSVGNILGINLKGPNNKQLQLPIFNPSTGTVRLGSRFEQIGVGRSLYNKESISDVDVFIAQRLHADWDILKDDISRAAYYGGTDPTNPWKLLTHTESSEATLSPLAIYLRSRSAVPTGLPEFANGSTFQGLDTPQRLAQLKSMIKNESLGLTKIGSEGGLTKGTLESRELEDFIVGGVGPGSRQSSFYQSMSKELQLVRSSIPPELRPRVTTAKAETLISKIGVMPEVGMTIAGVSPQQQALFGDLPKAMTDLPAYKDTAVQRIMSDTGLSKEAAEAAWEKISSRLIKTKGNYEAARRLGHLGEGSILLHEKFTSLQTEMYSPARVDELHMSPTEFMNKSFGPSELIGFSGLDPVTSTAQRTFIKDIQPVHDAETGANFFNLLLRKVYNVQTGSKIQVGGVKGLVAGTLQRGEFGRIRSLMNLYGEATGAPVNIPSFADAIAPLQYTQNKIHDPFNVLMQEAARVADEIAYSPANKTINEIPALQITKDYLAAMSKQGMYESQDVYTKTLRFIDDSSSIPYAGRLDRINAITQMTSEFFEKIGKLASSNAVGTQRSGLFTSFRQSKMTSLMDYMHRNAMPASAAFWDNTQINVPQLTTATEDLFSEMFRLGHVEGIQDIMGRLEYQGDPAMTAKFAQHFVGRDFTKPYGNVIPIEQAVTSPEGVKLSKMETRIGGVFDITNPAVQDNFSIKLKQPVYGAGGQEISYLPVPGKAAYGGGSNLYQAPGKGLAFNATPIEQKLANVIKFQNEPMLLTNAVSEYMAETDKMLFGKEGFYRARGIDPTMAISGFMESRAMPSEPFTVTIPEQMASRIRNPQVSEALLGGESFFATIARHPIQAAPYVKVKVDYEGRLGPNELGMDERMRAMFGADVDKDTFNMFFHSRGSAAERAAANDIQNLNSSQWKSLETLEMLYGSMDDSRNVTQFKLKSLPEQITGELGGNQTEEVLRRAIGGEGQYSNLLTQLQKNIEMHPTIGMNQQAKTELGHLFWAIRQVPISAKKGKMALDPNDPLKVYRQIKGGLAARSPEGAEQVMAGMREVMGGFKSKTTLTDRTATLYNELVGKSAKAGDEVSVMSDFLESRKDLIHEFVIDRNPAADKVAMLLTKDVHGMTPDKLYALEEAYRETGGAASAIPYLKGMVKERGTGISGVLGALNDVTRSYAKQAGTGLKPLAIGLGIAAAAALLTTNIKSPIPAQAVFSKGPGNFRPEEKTTITDQVPGEPLAGSMSSVNPPRRQLQTSRGTTTTIVAPMRQRTDLEVRMKSQDRRDTAEIQRLTGQIAGGSGITNMNVNYQNGWRNKMSRLRQKEIIKESLEE